MNKAKLLRESFRNKSLIRVIGAHNGITAKLGEEAGFDALWASGLEISASYGYPDSSVLGMSEFLHVATMMNNSSNLPVIADCDSGFGDLQSVKRMVKEYKNNGIAAICIEDKLYPKRNSFSSELQELAKIEDFVEKIIVAKDMLENSDTMLIARLESFIAGKGLEEAIKRAEVYCDSGVDAILVHSKLETTEEIYSFSRYWEKSDYKNIPLIIIPTIYSSLKIENIESESIKMVIYANQGLRASIAAVRENFSKIISDGTTKNIENNISKVNEVFKLISMK